MLWLELQRSLRSIIVWLRSLILSAISLGGSIYLIGIVFVLGFSFNDIGARTIREILE